MWKNGHKNKGWAGQVIEHYLGLPQNSLQAPDFGTWELKVVPVIPGLEGTVLVKESMAITMIEPAEVVANKFTDSHPLLAEERILSGVRISFLPSN